MRHVAKGLEKRQRRIFRFPNSIRSQLSIKIIDRETSPIEFAQATFLSFLFSFRLPSETIQLVRAFSSGALEVFSPHPRMT